MNRNQIADAATGTALERWFVSHPRLTTAGTVVAILLLQVLGAWLDGGQT